MSKISNLVKITACFEKDTKSEFQPRHWGVKWLWASVHVFLNLRFLIYKIKKPLPCRSIVDTKWNEMFLGQCLMLSTKGGSLLLSLLWLPLLISSNSKKKKWVIFRYLRLQLVDVRWNLRNKKCPGYVCNIECK